MNENTYGSRLLIAMEAKNATRKDLAAALGVSVQAIGDVLRGKSSAFTAGNNAKAAQFLRVSPNWLATGEGGMDAANFFFSESNQAPDIIGRSKVSLEIVELENNPDYPAIRRVNITAKAGVTGYAVDYIDEDRPPIFFRRDWYDSNGYKPEKLIAMRVTGESMVPSLHPGGLIVVNTAQTQPKQGIAFLVSFEGEVVVKRLVRDDGQWWLTSDNQDQRRYPRVKCNGETEIIGEVVYWQTAVI